MKSSYNNHHKYRNLLLCAAFYNAVRIQYTLNMKRNTLSNLKLSTASLLLVLLSFSSCKKAEDITIETPKPERRIDGSIEGNPTKFSNLSKRKIMHLYSDTVYILTSPLIREAGEQLIIDEGTLIKAVLNYSISIKQGGLLIANGTRENPIVFTSGAANGNQDKNWGGIKIEGKSVNNTSTTGVKDITDRSCSIKFMRIEFSSLTLDGVGSNSVVENVQVSYTKSASSFRIYGGTFNARNLVSYACGGPADFYITNGYTGKMQNLLAYRHPFFGNTMGNLRYDEPSFDDPDKSPDKRTSGIFIENNPAGDNQLPHTFPLISNVTVIGPHLQNGNAKEYTDTTVTSAALVTTNNARFKIRNSLFLGFPSGGWYVGDQLTFTNLNNRIADIGFSSFYSNNTGRTFAIHPSLGIGNLQFKNAVLASGYANELPQGADAFYRNPFDFENADLRIKESSAILIGANFQGTPFNDDFFNKVAYLGAIGNDNWLQGWTNFIPLRTNYNNPE